MIYVYFKLDDLYEIYTIFLDPKVNTYVSQEEGYSMITRLYDIGIRAANLLLNTNNPCEICKENIKFFHTRLEILTAKMY